MARKDAASGGTSRSATERPMRSPGRRYGVNSAARGPVRSNVPISSSSDAATPAIFPRYTIAVTGVAAW